jgi:hypothetical protein
MPLSKPTPRQHLHTREIVCRGYRRDDGLWDIEAALADTKTYSFDNQDRGGVAAGEPIHGMRMRLTVDDDLVVHDIEAATEHSPFSICGGATPKYAALKGLKIGPGWRKAVLAAVGGVQGCTHLTDLLVGPMAVAAFQTVTPAREKRSAAETDAKKPALLDSCHSFASDSPVVKRRWPAYYTGQE